LIYLSRGRSGGASQVAGVPGERGPILPTDVGEDNKKISGIFSGEVIIVDHGKISKDEK
jgi:hypothetical protein